MAFTVTFEQSELPELRTVLDRTMNTWEPHQQPKWLQQLSDDVDAALGIAPSVPFNARAVHAQTDQQ